MPCLSFDFVLAAVTARAAALALSSVCVFSAIAGCSGSVTTTLHGDADGGSDGGSPADAGTSDSTDASSGASGPAHGSGTVLLMSRDAKVAGVDYRTSFASASFALAEVPSPSSPCTTFTFGPCVATRCTTGTLATPPTRVVAGDVSIAGGRTPITLTPDPKRKSYEPFSDSTKTLWEGGETLSAIASGASSGVPDFELEATAPRTVRIAQPAVLADASFTVKRSAPLAITWEQNSATPNAMVKIVITSSQNHTSSQSVRCGVPSTDLALTIPAQALGQLDLGSGSINIVAETTTMRRIGDYDVSFVLRSPATYQGTLASTTAQIE